MQDTLYMSLPTDLTRAWVNQHANSYESRYIPITSQEVNQCKTCALFSYSFTLTFCDVIGI